MIVSNNQHLVNVCRIEICKFNVQSMSFKETVTALSAYYSFKK